MSDNTGFVYWVEDPLVKVMPYLPAPTVQSTQITVDAVRNEYESAQVIIRAEKDISKLTVSVSPLSGPSKTVPKVDAKFLGYLPVKHGTTDMPDEDLVAKAPADIPDSILDVRSVSVKTSRDQSVWLTVYVPKGSSPGTYTGTVQIASETGSQDIPISVKVHPVTLPDDCTLYVTNWFSTANIAKSHNLQMWSEPYWKMLEVYARSMNDYRQNTVLTPIFELITAKSDASGNLTFDFSRFDRWVELFKKAGLTTIEGGHLGGRSSWEAPDFDAGRMRVIGPDGADVPYTSVKVTSEEERKFLSQFFPALQKHLDEKGWTKDYFQHLVDEPIPANAESYKKLSSYVREFAPELKIIDASMCREIAGAIDIWVPQPQEVEGAMDFFKERRKAGDDLWFYTCLSPKGKYMNRFIDQQLIKTRLLHWMNFKYDMTGYLHWGYNQYQGDPFADLEPNWGGDTYLPPGDSHIVYPGRRGPLSSIRLEAMRDGLEDFELLKLLAKKDPKKAEKISSSVIRTMTDYTIDPAEFRAARAELIKALSK
ncbi:MAG: DUF4091 domain-containing protein [Armatimonadota bacterium]